MNLEKLIERIEILEERQQEIIRCINELDKRKMDRSPLSLF